MSATTLRRWALLLLLGTGSLAAAEHPPADAIASAHGLATEAGREIFARGGNAFDAAVAVSAALSVVEPESSGLGGGGFVLLHRASDGKDVFIDAREAAPAAATRDMYLDAKGEPDRKRSVTGPLSAAIPGLPAALVHLAQNYGRLPLKDSLAPAIRLAEKGFVVSDKTAFMLGFRKDALSPAAAKLYLPKGQPVQAGDRVRNPDIARVLRALARDGHAGFYKGKVAATLVEQVRRDGGIWSLEDLASYQVIERDPIRFRYGQYEIVTAPPPSSGGVALSAMFHMLAGYDWAALTPVQRQHLKIEVMRRAYRDRAIYLGDPDFVKIPLEMLQSPYYAAGLRASIRLDRRTPSEALPGISADENGVDTTHFSVIDREGNRVGLTQSVNLPFGSAYMAPGTGLMLNDHMDDFSVKPGVPNAYGLVGEDANAIAGGKRPLSSMTPTFLVGPERVAVLGTPGGSRIITMVFGALLALVDGASAEAAVAAPRLHHQYLPDTVSLEPGALDAALKAGLEALGHPLSQNERPWGNMQMVLWDRVHNRVEAASDPRWKPGKAFVGDAGGIQYR